MAAGGMAALQGIRVVDLTHHIAGPTCTMLLGDYGADVVKVEPVEGDPVRHMNFAAVRGHKCTFLAVNRSKRSLAVDLRTEEGRNLLLQLVGEADVFVENFRPGVAARLGLGYESLQALNPRLIYCSISGFGSSGPLRDRPALDVVIQAMGGVMSMTGEMGGTPLPAGAALADYTSGLQALIGILLALQARHVTGKGQKVEASMIGAVISMIGLRMQQYWATGEPIEPMGSFHPQVMPWGTYPCADKPIVVAVSTEPFWQRFCDAIGRADLVQHPDYASNALRLRNRTALHEALKETFILQPATHWLERLAQANVPSGPVNNLADIVADEQVRQLGILGEMPHPEGGTMPVVTPPVMLSDTPARITLAPPQLGEHTAEVLAGAGIDADAIGQLERAGVIRSWPRP